MWGGDIHVLDSEGLIRASCQAAICFDRLKTYEFVAVPMTTMIDAGDAAHVRFFHDQGFRTREDRGVTPPDGPAV